MTTERKLKLLKKMRLERLATSNKIGKITDRLCSRLKVKMQKCGERFDTASQLINDLKIGRFDPIDENS
jgi:hypothetical protein